MSLKKIFSDEDDEAVKVTPAETGIAPKTMLQRLAEIEAKQQAGASERTPKEQILEHGAVVQEARPDERVRWINIADPNIAESRRIQGYRILSAEEGGRRLGNELALAVIPREQYEKRVEHADKLHRARLGDNGEAILLRELDKVARELGKQGIRVTVDQLRENVSE